MKKVCFNLIYLKTCIKIKPTLFSMLEVEHFRQAIQMQHRTQYLYW